MWVYTQAMAGHFHKHPESTNYYKNIKFPWPSMELCKKLHGRGQLSATSQSAPAKVPVAIFLSCSLTFSSASAPEIQPAGL